MCNTLEFLRKVQHAFMDNVCIKIEDVNLVMHGSSDTSAYCDMQENDENNNLKDPSNGISKVQYSTYDKEAVHSLRINVRLQELLIMTVDKDKSPCFYIRPEHQPRENVQHSKNIYDNVDDADSSASTELHVLPTIDLEVSKPLYTGARHSRHIQLNSLLISYDEPYQVPSRLSSQSKRISIGRSSDTFILSSQHIDEDLRKPYMKKIKDKGFSCVCSINTLTNICYINETTVTCASWTDELLSLPVRG